ncbi:uncharacterized protein LOC109713718 [Ananas comosus]|uniref:PRA1 family protein n=1 Tax=Ananas comosus TaxID=4615 RepID=A0A6P5FJY6_ANACO|nr:uncharacterized protein LOC109713718 [Ananas comosus]
MANGAVILRRSAAAVVERAAAGARSTAAPPDAEAAAVRAVRNVGSFRVHYAALLWGLLLASLAPRHRASMLFLMAASKLVLAYGVLLRVFPNSALLRRVLDRRLVLGLFLLAVLLELAATDALGCLFAAMALGLPIVLLHAVFRVRDDLLLAEEGSAAAAANGGDTPEKKEEGDLESGPSR